MYSLFASASYGPCRDCRSLGWRALRSLTVNSLVSQMIMMVDVVKPVPSKEQPGCHIWDDFVSWNRLPMATWLPPSHWWPIGESSSSPWRATLLHQGAGWTPLRPICAGGASLNASALFFFYCAVCLKDFLRWIKGALNSSYDFAFCFSNILMGM